MIARFAPALFVCLWATGFVGARLGMPYAEPASFLSLRFVFAFTILALISVFLGAKWPNRKDTMHALIVGALIHGVYLGCVFWAVRNGMPGGIAAIIVGLQPLFVAVLAGIWLKEKISRRHWAGLALGLIGICLVIYPKLDVNNEGINTFTVLACLMAVTGMSVGTIYQKRYASKSDLRTGTALQYVGAIIPVGIYAILFENFQITWNYQSTFALAWLVFVLSIAATFLLMWLIREGSVSQVSSLFYLVPPVAAFMTWILFDETLTLLQIFGTLVCALAVALAVTKSKPQSNSP